MIGLLFGCNIEVDQDVEMGVSRTEFSVDTGLKNTHAERPNTLVENMRTVKYSGLTLAESLQLEEHLKATCGVVRIEYLSKRYRLRKYTATYQNALVSIELSLEQVR